MAMYIWVLFNAKFKQAIFFKIEKSKKKNVIFRHFYHFTPPAPRGISQDVSGLYHVRRGAGNNIHMCTKLYSLGRAKVFSSVLQISALALFEKLKNISWNKG